MRRPSLAVASVLAVAVLALLLFGCVEWLGGRNATVFVQRPKPSEIENVTNVTNVTAPVNVTVCEELETGVEECIVERAFANNSIPDCLKLNGSWITICIVKLATKNLAACTYLNDTDAVDDCYFRVSRAYEDSVCDRIVNATKKEECKLSFVSESCRALPLFERYLCDAVENDDESLCTKSGDNNLCLLKFSIQSRDACSQITSKGMREGCSAILERSDARCGVLTDAGDDQCYMIYAEESGRCSSCDRIDPTINSWKDDCYKACAVVADNFTYCSKLSTETKRDNCYLDFASQKASVAACRKIIMKMLAKLCYEKVAAAAVDPTVCDNLEPADRGNCYVTVFATPGLTYDSCMKMPATYDRDTCIFSVVKRTKDTTYCDSVRDAGLKSYCRSVS